MQNSLLMADRGHVKEKEEKKAGKNIDEKKMHYFLKSSRDGGNIGLKKESSKVKEMEENSDETVQS